MQADLIRAARTPKPYTNPTEERTTISTVSLRQIEKDQVRSFSLKKSPKLHCIDSNILHFSYQL
jgi:hypothetical protein